MLNDKTVTELSARADNALRTVPGVVGAVYFVRDPDGPGDARPRAVIVSIPEEHAHAAVHMLEGTLASVRRRPEGLGAQVREMMGEGIDRWAADAVDATEEIIKARAESVKKRVLAEAPPEICEHEVNLAHKVIAELDKNVPETIRAVLAVFIEHVRKGWALEAEMTSESVATFMWDLMGSPTCGGHDKAPEAGA